jgi:hypothetical protein
MHFEGRELKPYAQPISAAELREGTVYFSVHFVDSEMLIPIVAPLVFVGRDLEPGDDGQLYFQDIESYRRGVRYGSTAEDDLASFILEPEERPVIFDYERALEELMSCSLRRRMRSASSDSR